MRRSFAKHGARWLLGLVLTLLAAAETMGLGPASIVDRLDLFLYDMRMRLPEVRLDKRIVIVDIDEKSLAEIGRWPWSRDVVAAMIDQLNTRYHVRATAFDIVFAEPDISSGYPTLAALARHELKDIPRFGEQLRTLKATLDFDARMAAAMRDRPVVMGYNLSNESQAIAKGQLPAPAFTTADLGGRSLDATVWRAYGANLPQLQLAARAGGFFNPMLDPDGVIRSVPLLARIGDDFYESLALAGARVALGASKVQPVFLQDAVLSQQQMRDYGVLDELRLNTRPQPTAVPVERHLTALITYRGRGGRDGGAYRYVSAVDVIKGRLPPAMLENAIALVGTTVPGLYDLRSTPVSPNYPGVEIHANVMASILDNDFKQRPDFSAGFNLVQIILIGAALGSILPLLSPLFAMGLATAALAAVAGFNYWLYDSANLVLPLAMALLLIVALFLFNLAWGYLFEHRQRRAMVNLFGEYVAPELVAEMAANPARYSMEGESRELTVMFSDVRGFTTISEGLEPNALREYINAYLTAMSGDIRGNRGTLDKYIGDAVMAFWGAPVALPDHASRAVATALQMQRSVIALNANFVERGWPALHIGIGLNTGMMRVGDMGSKVRRAYTVMGDAVNLSSRLESITKIYGVGIVVGAATRAAAPQYAYRELDRVRVKGKNEPAPIYQPLDFASALSQAQQEALARWHQALQLVREQQWDSAEREILDLQRESADGLYALYLGRIAVFRREAPPPDWDGVTTFDVK
ncbi:MAG: guanylate cyclase [Herbaspirillum sp.]|jgi:adenylate cyclase|nr:guanylate cyclase [Herbaspirillum sp.]